jgi:hypothetical protein
VKIGVSNLRVTREQALRRLIMETVIALSVHVVIPTRDLEEADAALGPCQIVG